MPFNETEKGKTYHCPHPTTNESGVCNQCLIGNFNTSTPFEQDIINRLKRIEKLLTNLQTQQDTAIEIIDMLEGEKKRENHRCSTMCGKDGCEYAKGWDLIDRKSEYNQGLTQAQQLIKAKYLNE